DTTSTALNVNTLSDNGAMARWTPSSRQAKSASETGRRVTIGSYATPSYSTTLVRTINAGFSVQRRSPVAVARGASSSNAARSKGNGIIDTWRPLAGRIAAVRRSTKSGCVKDSAYVEMLVLIEKNPLASVR